MDSSAQEINSSDLSSAQVVLPCQELDPSLNFYTQILGFKVETIYPADAPHTAVLSGHGIRIRLQPDLDLAPGYLRLLSSAPELITSKRSPQQITAPNGTRVEIVPAHSKLKLPELDASFIIQAFDANSSWQSGRAGMQYRDLLPGRFGGRFIASHIAIPEGGPVNDYAHYHNIRFQMIYCRRGWVKVVYEDQGEPFVLNAGDCVLQPPLIRHRVLESSTGLEVIEFGSPAEHDTHGDLEISLPNSTYRPEREFDGQQFVRHQRDLAQYQSWRQSGYEYRDLGIYQATKGMADVTVIRPAQHAAIQRPVPSNQVSNHQGEIQFFFILDGRVDLQTEQQGKYSLKSGDAVAIPAEFSYHFTSPSSELELLSIVVAE